MSITLEAKNSITLEAKKLLKLQVRFLQDTLPSSLFDSLYDFTFPKYKALIQIAYLLQGFLFFSWWNGKKWRMIREIYAIMPYTLVGIGGLEATYSLGQSMNEQKIPGDFVELGVARGGCAALMGSVIFNKETAAENRTLWLFDSYEGLPEPTEKDFREDTTGEHVRPLPKGSCLGTLDEVKQLMFNIKGYPEDKIKFIKGWFQDTVPSQGQEIEKIAVLRIDGDWYDSTKVCLEGLYDKVVSGGAIVIDDYQSCYGCERAVTEFIDRRNLNIKIHLDGRGGCYFIKP